MHDARMDVRINTGDIAASSIGNAAAMSLQTALLVSMFDVIDYGLIVLGADSTILVANQLAGLELGRGRFVQRRQDKLAPSSARRGTEIEAALANVQRGQRSLVTLSSGDGELTLSFVPLNSGAQSGAQIPDAALALVIVGKRDACDVLLLREYGHLHGLTGAEQALLPAITRGLSEKAMARLQCVALSTVRTQFGSIRGKTGVKSLRALMARLTTLPPIRTSSKQSTVFCAATPHR